MKSSVKLWRKINRVIMITIIDERESTIVSRPEMKEDILSDFS